MARTWKYVAALGAAVIFVAGGYYYWQTARTISVAVASVEKSVEVRVFGIGTMEAQVVSKTGFQVAGKLTEVHADQGDFVAAGALLAKLEDSAQRARLAKSEATVRQAATNLQRAQALRDRAQVTHAQKRNVSGRRQSLAGRGAVSQEAAEDALAVEEIAHSDLKVAESDAAVAAVLQDDAKAQRDIEAVTLSQHELRAPFAARVITRHKELGSVASPGEPVFTLIVPESIWVRAYVDEALAGGLQVGQTAYVRLRSEAGTVVEAEVVRIDQESDRVTEERRVYVRCRACKAEHQVRFLGEQAEVEIVKKVVASGLFVPLRLVEGYDGRSGTIWVIDDGRLAKRKVELGDRLLDGRVEITSTLPATTHVVIEAAPVCRKGARHAQRPADRDVNLAIRDIKHNLGRFLLTCLGLSLLLGIVLAMIGIYRGLIEEALGLARAAQAQVWVVEGGTRGPFAEVFASARRHPRSDCVALGSRVRGLGRLPERRGAARRGDQAPARRRRGNRPPRRGIGHRGGASAFAFPLRGGRRPARRVRARRANHTRAGHLHGRRHDEGSRCLRRRSGRVRHAAGRAETSVRSHADRGTPRVRSHSQCARFDGYGQRGAGAAQRRRRSATVRGQCHPLEAPRRPNPGSAGDRALSFSRRAGAPPDRPVHEPTARVSTVIIGLIIYTMTLDKKRSIATLKLIGAPDRRIIGLIVQQALAMGLISFAVGVVLIHAAQGYFPRRLLLQDWDAAMLFVAVLLVCLLASALGVRTALKIDPATALTG